jgi:hypothetical protein
MSDQKILVDPRPIIIPLQKCRRSQLDEVLKPLLVDCQKSKVIGSIFGTQGIFDESALRSNISFVADDRLNLQGLCFPVKLEGPIKVAMIGQRKGRHSQLASSLKEVIQSPRTI